MSGTETLGRSIERRMVYGFLDNALDNTEGFKEWDATDICIDMRDRCCDIEDLPDVDLLIFIRDWKNK